jgi:hypothetical protein
VTKANIDATAVASKIDNKILSIAANFLIRNIDQVVSENENELFLEEKKESKTLLLIGTIIRFRADNIFFYFAEEEIDALNPLPLSLSSYILARCDENMIVKSWRIDAAENIFVQLDYEACKKTIKEVENFIEQIEDAFSYYNGEAIRTPEFVHYESHLNGNN